MTTSYSFAQENGKGQQKNENVQIHEQKKNDTIIQKKDSVKKKNDDINQIERNRIEGSQIEEEKIEKKKDNTNSDKTQGNAYGKNKGELEGKEFGQQRSIDAKKASQDKKEKKGKKNGKIKHEKDKEMKN
jgi:hypothetical protein